MNEQSATIKYLFLNIDTHIDKILHIYSILCTVYEVTKTHKHSFLMDYSKKIIPNSDVSDLDLYKLFDYIQENCSLSFPFCQQKEITLEDIKVMDPISKIKTPEELLGGAVKEVESLPKGKRLGAMIKFQELVVKMNLMSSSINKVNSFHSKFETLLDKKSKDWSLKYSIVAFVFNLLLRENINVLIKYGLPFLLFIYGYFETGKNIMGQNCFLAFDILKHQLLLSKSKDNIKSDIDSVENILYASIAQDNINKHNPLMINALQKEISKNHHFQKTLKSQLLRSYFICAPILFLMNTFHNLAINYLEDDKDIITKINQSIIQLKLELNTVQVVFKYLCQLS